MVMVRRAVVTHLPTTDDRDCVWCSSSTISFSETTAAGRRLTTTRRQCGGAASFFRRQSSGTSCPNENSSSTTTTATRRGTNDVISIIKYYDKLLFIMGKIRRYCMLRPITISCLLGSCITFLSFRIVSLSGGNTSRSSPSQYYYSQTSPVAQQQRPPPRVAAIRRRHGHSLPLLLPPSHERNAAGGTTRRGGFLQPSHTSIQSALEGHNPDRGNLLLSLKQENSMTKRREGRSLFESGFNENNNQGEYHEYIPSPHDDDDNNDENNKDEGGDDEEKVSSYYAFDDDYIRNPMQEWDDDTVQDETTCRRVNWHRLARVNCNSVHEVDLPRRMLLNKTFYLGGGDFRTVYCADLDRPLTGSLAVKTYSYERNISYRDFEFVRMDALVSERLSWSSRIVNIYGYCGVSILSELMQWGSLDMDAMPTADEDDNPSTKDIVLHENDDVNPQNSLTATDKLFLSLEMAEAVLLLHSFPDGVIVHDDIQLHQFLFTETGQLKLNDFNRAEIMLYDENDNEYCRYRNGPGPGVWRSPEEYWDYPLNEKIDVWSLGFNMYALLTGLPPFYETYQQQTRPPGRHPVRHNKNNNNKKSAAVSPRLQVQRNIKLGEKPYVDDRYRNRSFAEQQLTEIMERCWTYRADDRIDIFELVRLLRQAVEANDKNQSVVVADESRE